MEQIKIPIMDEATKMALEWSLSQDHQSVAARYAICLAKYITEFHAFLEEEQKRVSELKTAFDSCTQFAGRLAEAESSINELVHGVKEYKKEIKVFIDDDKRKFIMVSRRCALLEECLNKIIMSDPISHAAELADRYMKLIKDAEEAEQGIIGAMPEKIIDGE